MAKRHQMVAGNWESIFGRLEELVLANSGEDAFEEIFKLLVAKLFAEIRGDAPAFGVGPTAAQTAEAVNELLARAAERWRGILPLRPSSRLTNEHLAVCVEALQPHSLLDTNLEVLDGAFEYLMSRSSKGAKGQFFTPRHVVDCCVQMIDPGPDETLVDPACGSGGFLIHTLTYLRAQHPEIDVRRYCDRNLWGFDFDGRVIRIAKALMLIAGDGSSNLFRLNSLLTPRMNLSLFADSEDGEEATPRLTIEDVARARKKAFKGFDVVLTNPPFAGELRERHLLDGYDVNRPGRRIERDVLFLERCVQLLRPGGRLGIVLPHNKLGGHAWSYVREWLLRHVEVVAVLGLGRNTFLPHTHQKAAVLFGRKRQRPVRSVAKDEILFLISQKDGKDSRGAIRLRPRSDQNAPLWVRVDHDLNHVVETFRGFAEEKSLTWSRS